MRVLIAVPTFETIATECFESIFSQKDSNDNIDFKAFKGYDCARARNEIAKYALDNVYDYVLMVDSDVILPDNALTLLIESGKDIIFGAYPRKLEPSKSEAFMAGYDGYPPAARWNMTELIHYPKNIIPIKGSGFGCALINTKIFNEFDYPWFNYVINPDNTFLSEDLYFCSKVSSKYQCYIHSKVLCKHIGKSIAGYFAEV